MARSKKNEIKKFDIFDNDNDFESQVQESLLRLTSKTKKSIPITSISNVSDTFLSFDHSWFLFQKAINQVGLKQGAMTEIIAPDGVGKTSLSFAIAGQIMRNYNSPILYIETEHKKMANKRILECLSYSERMAEEILKKIHFMFITSLVDCIYQLENWAMVCRSELSIPKEIPLFIIIDSYSKLMNKAEIEGRSGYDELNSNQKAQVSRFIVGEASMKDKLGHSEISHSWSRCIARFCEDYNVSVLNINHQNTSISASGGGSFIPEDVKAAYNKTKVGGNALNQSAAHQFTLLRTMFVKQGTEKIAERCKGTFVKNSYGARGSEFWYEILIQNNSLADGWRMRAISFERPFAEWLVAESPFKIVESRKRYTFEEKNWENLTAIELAHKFWSNTELMSVLYKHIGLELPTFEFEASFLYNSEDIIEDE